MWSILNHLDQLNVLNQLSTEYVCECPVCNGRRLTISKATGAYSCWTTECPSADIRAAVGGPEAHYSQLLPARDYRAAQINEEIELAQLPTNAAPVDLNDETWYQYSHFHRVHRYRVDDQKFTIPYYNTTRGKGDRLWLPYRASEIPLARNRWLLAVEGEKCVEYARSIGLVAITWQGSSWTPVSFIATITMLKAAGVRGLVYWPDHDIPGYRKAQKLWQVCAAPILPHHKFKIVVLDPRRIWQGIAEGQDIADWVQAGVTDVKLLQTLANEMKHEKFGGTYQQ